VAAVAGLRGRERSRALPRLVRPRPMAAAGHLLVEDEFPAFASILCSNLGFGVARRIGLKSVAGYFQPITEFQRISIQIPLLISDYEYSISSGTLSANSSKHWN